MHNLHIPTPHTLAPTPLPAAVLAHLHDADAALTWLRAHLCPGAALRTDSRAVQPGDAFLAWPGRRTDARLHVAQAIERGAVACLLESRDLPPELPGELCPAEGPQVALALVNGLKALAGPIAAAWYGQPSQHLRMLAVTGTNGKTSTAWWLAQALCAHAATQGRSHQPCALVGTLGVGIAPHLSDTGMTTPDAVALQAALAGFVQQGAVACAMEASSIGLAEHRLAGTRLHTAIFTNCTQDHLDYHGSMQAYWQAKAALFDWPGLRAAVVNVDDPHGQMLAHTLRSRTALDLWTVAVRPDAPGQGQSLPRLYARNLRPTARGMCFEVVQTDPASGAIQECASLHTVMLGEFNAANLLGVVAALRTLGLTLERAVQVCAGLHAPPGRMEHVRLHDGAGAATDAGQDAARTAPLPLVVVDYAHTPDALAKALSALGPQAKARAGRLWCVFGCGGDRDSSKRALMGAAAQAGADAVIVTSDNPRSEDPQRILEDILQGMAGGASCATVAVEADRAAAIHMAVRQADPRDIILLAGKGHETCQEVAGRKNYFCDRAQARAALQSRANAASLCAASPAGDAAPALTLGAALHWVAAQDASARIVAGRADTAIARVHTDSRSVRAGDLFVALKGQRMDAHAFLHDAARQGAAAAIVQHDGDAALLPPGLPLLAVADTTAALGALSAGWRMQFDLPLVAVTGSNGKTTVTQMLASIFRAHAGEAGAFATQGNFNNAIGVPLTLLRLNAAHRVGVVELGMNHPGEISQLARLCRPTVALVNNAQREHQEFMHTVQAVAEENGSVISYLGADGVAVLPADGEDGAHIALWRTLAGSRRVLTFGGAQADVQAAAVQWHEGAWHLRLHTPVGDCATVLHIAGRHNVRNALAVAACAVAAGVGVQAIAQGLSQFRPVQGRSGLSRIQYQGRWLDVVDDSYNANPDSVQAAIDVLASLPGPRLLVLGDMGEVGSEGPHFHREAGASARAAGIETLLAVGPLARHAVTAFGAGAMHFHDMSALLRAVPVRAACGVRSVLVKGSRSMRMEQVIHALHRSAAAPAPGPVDAAATAPVHEGAPTC